MFFLLASRPGAAEPTLSAQLEEDERPTPLAQSGTSQPSYSQYPYGQPPAYGQYPYGQYPYGQPPPYYRPPYPPPRLLAPPPPWIRPRHPVGGFIAISGFGTVVAGQTGGVEYLRSGGGVGLSGGLEIGRMVALQLGYDASFHNPATACSSGLYVTLCGANYLLLETIAADFKLRIPTDTRWVPYFQAGALVSWIGRQNYLTDATGGGFEAGGGFDVWVSPFVTLGFQTLYRGIKMQDYGTYTGTSTYLNLVMLSGTFAVHL